MTATTVRLPAIYRLDEPSGRVRVGFRIPGTRRKVQRTFDLYAVGEAWAEDARRRVLGALMAGEDVEAVVADVLGRTVVDEEVVAQLAAGAPPAAPGSPTLKAYAWTWLEARRGSVERTTWSNYETHMIYSLADPGDDRWAPIGSRPIDQITRTEVEAWRTRQAEAGANPPTLNGRKTVLSMIFEWALADRLIPSNPVKFVRDLKHSPAPKPTLSADAEVRMLADPRLDPSTDLGRRHRLFVLVGLYAGLRYEESAALEADALVRTDDGRAYLSIRQVRRRNGEIRPFTKSGENRLVPIGGDVLALWSEVALATAPGALMFPWKYDTYRHSTWRGLTDRAGINRQKSTAKGREAVRFGYHSLRHTCGSRLAAAGRPRSEIALFLGHADESTTAGYIHASIDGVRHDAALAALGMTATA